jgi:hypothetical protein
MPKIKPPTLKNTKLFWARQVPTFPVHHPLVGSLSLDGLSIDKFLKEALLSAQLYVQLVYKLPDQKPRQSPPGSPLISASVLMQPNPPLGCDAP